MNSRNVEPSNPSEITEVDQRLDIGEGVLYTSYTLSQGPRVEQAQFFSQIRKNLFVLRAHCEQGTV
jgi:trehalose/maltose hydrolase-like predicted phosphorylase